MPQLDFEGDCLAVANRVKVSYHRSDMWLAGTTGDDR